MQNKKKWLIGIDRGGTFTDIVARTPDGRLVSRKLLSEDPGRYDDAAIFALRELLELPGTKSLPEALVHSIRMGTTVATNALLERKGVPVGLIVTEGFGDILEIGYQSRPQLFELNIRKPELLYTRVVEVNERVDASGKVVRPLKPDAVRDQLQPLYDAGIRSLAVVLLNAYLNDSHEQQIGRIARAMGFTQVSLSAEIMRVQKVVSRGDTTLVDAYLNPVLQQYVKTVKKHTGRIPLQFMKSSGGLTDAGRFSAKDAIISGPAGGVIGYARIARILGIDKMIGFDMGGTSTDVSRYENGSVEKVYETETAGIRMQTPMINVVTVAAGGGSVLHFDGLKMTVGPDSAGANPGPACYSNGGPLTVTDANLMLGRIIPDYFPTVFGPEHKHPLDGEIVRRQFEQLAGEISAATGIHKSPYEVALGFIRIANENMIKPIKEISVAKGFNIRDYTLCCFGGAGAQHACSIARSLGMKRVLLHPFAGVLSAYGMILADIVQDDTRAVLQPFDVDIVSEVRQKAVVIAEKLKQRVMAEGIAPEMITVRYDLDIRPEGADTSETVLFDEYEATLRRFVGQYRQHYGFVPEGELEIVNLRVEVSGSQFHFDEPIQPLTRERLSPKEAMDRRRVYWDDGSDSLTPIFHRNQLQAGHMIDGPAIIIEANSTIVVAPDFRAMVNERGHLLLEAREVQHGRSYSTACDPILLEIFNNLFMSVAEQMGRALQRTAHSVNIKERLDFSCAVFDANGGLVANAPHIPVHLGAMGESVIHIMQANRDRMQPGDVFVTNDPYHGGSHLPDVTVVTPVFSDGGKLIFSVASRGHHADIGGITPGSMPPFSHTLEEEGVVLNNVRLVHAGRFDEAGVVSALKNGRWPARNMTERLSDLRAQLAANVCGVRELKRLIGEYSLKVVQAYMGHVQMNAEQSMRRALSSLRDGEYRAEDFLDDGTALRVCITVRGDSAIIDFTGTDARVDTNLNAPPAVVRAAVLYVFRTLIRESIPLNNGCFRPLMLKIPAGSVLNPTPGAAVAGGNVETSQRIVDVLYRALGIVAASQGTMNNFTFGEKGYGYYETIAGGAGAGHDFDGAHAVHTHMTNTRITDPEVLEYRYPEIRLERFSVRRGSGGKGHYCGGDGVVREFQFLKPRTISLLSERRVYPTYGLNGAKDGAKGHNQLWHNGQWEDIGGKGLRQVYPGDRVRIETPGGGGYCLTERELADHPPAAMRRLIRKQRWQRPTSGLCKEFAQTNVLILPRQFAPAFEQFCRRNPKPCPLLEVLPAGDPIVKELAPGADIRTDVPLYCYSRTGKSVLTLPDVVDVWQDDFVTFLVGCSFTFEVALLRAGLPVRHIELGCNVPMYITNRLCTAVEPFQSPVVVSMRPMTTEQAQQAYHITSSYPSVHGAPLVSVDGDPATIITNPNELGIRDLSVPDFGDAGPIRNGEVPVFWACGVTTQIAAQSAGIPVFISHAPGHMFITDRTNEELKQA